MNDSNAELTPIIWKVGIFPLRVGGHLRVIGPGDLIDSPEELNEIGVVRVAELVQAGTAEIFTPGSERPEPQLSAQDRADVTRIIEGAHDRIREMENAPQLERREPRALHFSGQTC